MTRLHRTPEGVIKECEAKSPETCKFGGMHFDISERAEAERYNDIMNALAEGKLRRETLPTKYYSNEDFLKLGPPLKTNNKKEEVNFDEVYNYKNFKKEIDEKNTKEELAMTTDELLGIKAKDNIDFKFIDDNHSNPNYREGGKYRINCQTAVLAFELRCRGYDVQARGNDTKQARELSYSIEKAYINRDTGVYPEEKELQGVNYKQLYERLNEEVKPNERYLLSVKWRNYNSAHVVNVYRNEQGEIILFDPQSNRVSKGEQIKEYFKEVKMRSVVARTFTIYHTKLTRVDNTDINPYIAKNVLIVNKTEDNKLDNEVKEEKVKKKEKTNKPKKEKKENRPKSNVELPEMLTKFATKKDLMALQEEYSDKELNQMFKDIKDPVSFVNKMNELLGV